MKRGKTLKKGPMSSIQKETIFLQQKAAQIRRELEKLPKKRRREAVVCCKPRIAERLSRLLPGVMFEVG